MEIELLETVKEATQVDLHSERTGRVILAFPLSSNDRQLDEMWEGEGRCQIRRSEVNSGG